MSNDTWAAQAVRSLLVRALMALSKQLSDAALREGAK
jgi:hypothetical protein